jgi:hypothetical protein
MVANRLVIAPLKPGIPGAGETLGRFGLAQERDRIPALYNRRVAGSVYLGSPCLLTNSLPCSPILIHTPRSLENTLI